MMKKLILLVVFLYFCVPGVLFADEIEVKSFKKTVPHEGFYRMWNDGSITKWVNKSSVNKNVDNRQNNKNVDKNVYKRDNKKRKVEIQQPLRRKTEVVSYTEMTAEKKHVTLDKLLTVLGVEKVEYSDESFKTLVVPAFDNIHELKKYLEKEKKVYLYEDQGKTVVTDKTRKLYDVIDIAPFVDDIRELFPTEVTVVKYYELTGVAEVEGSYRDLLKVDALLKRTREIVENYEYEFSFEGYEGKRNRFKKFLDIEGSITPLRAVDFPDTLGYIKLKPAGSQVVVEIQLPNEMVQVFRVKKEGGEKEFLLENKDKERKYKIILTEVKK